MHLTCENRLSLWEAEGHGHLARILSGRRLFWPLAFCVLQVFKAEWVRTILVGEGGAIRSKGTSASLANSENARGMHSNSSDIARVG
jgi:hypothetical protein